MNQYLCLYNGHKVTVEAETSYAAQEKAVVIFKAMYPRKKIKGWNISVHLIKDPVTGEIVIPASLF